jgi:hypothetical protein
MPIIPIEAKVPNDVYPEDVAAMLPIVLQASEQEIADYLPDEKELRARLEKQLQTPLAEEGQLDNFFPEQQVTDLCADERITCTEIGLLAAGQVITGYEFTLVEGVVVDLQKLQDQLENRTFSFASIGEFAGLVAGSNWDILYQQVDKLKTYDTSQPPTDQTGRVIPLTTLIDALQQSLVDVDSVAVEVAIEAANQATPTPEINFRIDPRWAFIAKVSPQAYELAEQQPDLALQLISDINNALAGQMGTDYHQTPEGKMRIYLDLDSGQYIDIEIVDAFDWRDNYLDRDQAEIQAEQVGSLDPETAKEERLTDQRQLAKSILFVSSLLLTGVAAFIIQAVRSIGSQEKRSRQEIKANIRYGRSGGKDRWQKAPEENRAAEQAKLDKERSDEQFEAYINHQSPTYDPEELMPKSDPNSWANMARELQYPQNVPPERIAKIRALAKESARRFPRW